MPQIIQQSGEGQDQYKVLLTESVRLFSGLDNAELDALLALSRPLNIKARDEVCRKGEPGDALYIVVSGKLKVAAMAEDGREAILAILEDGETFGEMSLLDARPRSASVIAVQDSELLVIQRQDFIPYLGHHPKVAVSLLGIFYRLEVELGRPWQPDLRYPRERQQTSESLGRRRCGDGRTKQLRHPSGGRPENCVRFGSDQGVRFFITGWGQKNVNSVRGKAQRLPR